LKRITVDTAKPGQILAEKVARHDGVLLASAGAEVTDGLLKMLVRLNVDTIVVEEDERRTEEEIRGDHKQNLLRLERAFRRVGGQPILMALKKTIAFLSKEEMEKAIFALKESQEKPQELGPGEDGEEAPEASLSPESKEASKTSTLNGKAASEVKKNRK
jgi:hypothetical protein